jgi:hypothetical protein
MTAAASERDTSAPSARPAGSCTVHCGIRRDGTTTAPTKAPIRPRYDPVMKRRCSSIRWVAAAHRPIERVPKVNTDKP